MLENKMLENKVLLITGGTGSFGNALLEKIKDMNLKEIRIFSRDEKKQFDMKQKYKNYPNIKYYIGNVREYSTIDTAMKGVDYVFHAAALKQVPSCEEYPFEAVKTNIIGTENVLTCAINNKVKRVVVLSTDKAVYPVNAMGISKAMAEKIAIKKAKEQNDTIICRTRYGNVMASRGSVIPLFKEQIEQGKELTVTVGEMTRFMMSLNQAVDLVLYAFENGENGDLFVQKSPAVKLSILAEAIKKMYGKEDYPVKYIGNRGGEKLYEVLINGEEMCNAIDLGQYYKIGNKQYRSTTDEYTSDNTHLMNVDEMIEMLKEI